MLATTLADVRKRIAKRPKLNENDTKATLIEPVLRALGWDVHDVEEVAREYKAPRAKPVDYALLVMREPKLHVEATRPGDSIEFSWASPREGRSELTVSSIRSQSMSIGFMLRACDMATRGCA